MKLSALIAELEAAPEGTRELSDKVLLACGWTQISGHAALMSKPSWDSPNGAGYDDGTQPDPSRSLDDAVALVRKGYAWQIRWNCSADGEDLYANARCWPFSNPRDEATTKNFWANANTPALALCIAILRSLEAV